MNELQIEAWASTHSEPPVIRHAWLMIVPMPCFIDDDGRIWLERLWHRDLVRHFAYLQHITLAAPCFAKRDGGDLLRVDVPAGATLHIVPLAPMHTKMQALVGLPETAAQLWRAVAGADIVQAGVVGWPYSLGWLANPMALLLKKKLLILVESATWRTPEFVRADWKRKLRARVTEGLARFFVNRASLNVFSHDAYRQSLLTRGRTAGVVLPASWIDDDDMLSDAHAKQIWRQKQRDAPPVRFLFAARLTEEKGALLLCRAIELLQDTSAPLAIDVIGEGPERARCELVAARRGNIPVRVLDPVAYGPDFFALVRRYHALIAPSLSDEQPRIVFDAAAQAVPLIASDTDGLRPHVAHEQTGLLVSRGDPSALARALLRAAGEPQALERYGMAAMARARGMTHAHMHRTRWQVLVEHFGAG